MNVGSSFALRIVGPTQQRCSLLLLQLWASPRCCCYQGGIKKRWFQSERRQLGWSDRKRHGSW